MEDAMKINSNPSREQYATELLNLREQISDLLAGSSLRKTYIFLRDIGLLSMAFGTFCRYMRSSNQPMTATKSLASAHPFDQMVRILRRQRFSAKHIYKFLCERKYCRVSYTTFLRHTQGSSGMAVYINYHELQIKTVLADFYVWNKGNISKIYNEIKGEKMSTKKNYISKNTMCSIDHGELVVPKSLIDDLSLHKARSVRAMYSPKFKQIALKFFATEEQRTLPVTKQDTEFEAILTIPFTAFCENFKLKFRYVVYLPADMAYGLHPGGDPFDVLLNVGEATRSPTCLPRAKTIMSPAQKLLHRRTDDEQRSTTA
jgi:hypothetical protein